MKYIIFKGGDVVLFSRTINHDWMARQIGAVPVSAGFVRMSIGMHLEGRDGEIVPRAYGRSLSLNLEPLPGDSELIAKQFCGDDFI